MNIFSYKNETLKHEHKFHWKNFKLFRFRIRNCLFLAIFFDDGKKQVIWFWKEEGKKFDIQNAIFFLLSVSFSVVLGLFTASIFLSSSLIDEIS